MDVKPVSIRLRVAGFVCILAGIALLGGCTSLLPPIFVDRPATRTAEVILLEEKREQTRQAWQRETQAAATQQAQAAATQAELAARATATLYAQQTAAAEATAVAAMTATQVVHQTATQQAAGLAAQVQTYQALGYIPASSGRYVRLDDYEQNLALHSGLVARRTGYSPKVFVVRADVDYEVAAGNANWFITGCGFLYWDNGQENYYSVMAALDGYVYARLFMRGRQYDLGRYFYGVPPRPKGSYPVTLIVNQERSYFFIGDELLKKTEMIDSSLTDGALSYMLASGSNNDFGTRCSFHNVELWMIEE